MGKHIAEILSSWGYTIVAVSDSQGGVYNEHGLDIASILEKQDDPRALPEVAGAQAISNEELLELDVDVLIPAAVSNQITPENVSNIKARIILEMANAPITPQADVTLAEHGVAVLPDIIANTGGVVVSYFEWLQNSSNDYWSEEKVFERLDEVIIEAFDAVLAAAEKNSTSLRTAAYRIAIEKILDAERIRGVL